jgi:hypothetical protein
LDEGNLVVSLSRTLLFLLPLLPVVGVAQIEPPGCSSYEPAVVALHGTLIRRTFAGPPNYTDIQKGDQPETYFLLNLDSPICVNEDKSSPELYPLQKDVHRVQLVLDEQAYERFKMLLGKRVVATGSLFGAHTGHHHTSILLTVTSLEKARWK